MRPRRSEILGLAFDAIDERGLMRIFRTSWPATWRAILTMERAKTKTSLRSRVVPAELLPMIGRHRQWVNEMMLKWGRESYPKEPLLMSPTSAACRGAVKADDTAAPVPSSGERCWSCRPRLPARHGQSAGCRQRQHRQVADRMGHSTTWSTMQRDAHPVEGGDEAAASALGGQLQIIMRKADVPS